MDYYSDTFPGIHNLKTYIPYRSLLFAFALSLVLMACEKEIQVDLPESEPKLVVEGRIETNAFPILQLTQNIGYFEPTDISTFENLFARNATVTVSVDGETHALEEICTQEIPEQFIPLVSASLGISQEDLETINYCFYTLPLADILAGNVLLGQPGKTYDLTIEWDGNTYTSSTTIPEPIALDTLWFQREGHPEFGFVWAELSDPDTLGNAYRWWAQRINQNESGAPKDPTFIAPLGSTFDDRFINGKTVPFGFARGDQQPGDTPDEFGFFRLGDTVVVKFSAVDIQVYEFLRSFETEAQNAGNPFATPSPIKTNITGNALGVWAGYGNAIDTVFAVE